MMESEMLYLCLECGKEFRNDLKLAVCPVCLKKEKENYENGIISKYITVLKFLKNQMKKKINNIQNK